jgi:hypothetical protein
MPVAIYSLKELGGASGLSLKDVPVRAAGGLSSWLRTLAAYWSTMIAASVFMAGSLIGLQGLAIAVLPRRHFLRVSPALQLIAFAVLVATYLLQRVGFVADDLLAAQSSLAASPSYWFLGLFETLNRSATMPVLAARACMGVMVATALAALAYGVSYRRTLRGIAEEPDATAYAPVRQHLVVTHGATGGLANFALKTLGRSAQPRNADGLPLGIRLRAGCGVRQDTQRSGSGDGRRRRCLARDQRAASRWQRAVSVMLTAKRP